MNTLTDIELGKLNKLTKKMTLKEFVTKINHWALKYPNAIVCFPDYHRGSDFDVVPVNEVQLGEFCDKQWLFETGDEVYMNPNAVCIGNSFTDCIYNGETSDADWKFLVKNKTKMNSRSNPCLIFKEKLC